MTPPKVGAVVLHYRNWPAIRATIDSLLAQSAPADAVVVVDNHSGGAAPSEIAGAYPQAQILAAPANLGYAGGMNLGIERMLEQGMDHILLLTHDCVLDPHCLHRLSGRMQQNHRLGAVGPLLSYRSDPGRVWSAGGIVKRATRNTDHWGSGEPVSDWANRPPRRVEWLDGACVLLRADALRLAGSLNERYFLYYEEAEYLVKLAEQGWRVECIAAARAAQEPSPIAPYFRTRNSLGFIQATAPGRFVAGEILRVLRDVAADLVRPAAPTQRHSVTARLRGLVDFLLGRWGPPDHRLGR